MHIPDGYFLLDQEGTICLINNNNWFYADLILPASLMVRAHRGKANRMAEERRLINRRKFAHPLKLVPAVCTACP
jgi:hypothetical protein